MSMSRLTQEGSCPMWPLIGDFLAGPRTWFVGRETHQRCSTAQHPLDLVHGAENPGKDLSPSRGQAPELADVCALHALPGGSDNRYLQDI